MSLSSGISAQPRTQPAPIDVLTAIRRRRFYRNFEPRAVPAEVLRELAWAAGRAQQARAGVRHLVIVDDQALMAAAREILPGFVNNSLAMIVICTDSRQVGESLGQRGVEHNSRLDSGAAAAHLALAARAYGLGTCTVTSWPGSAVQALLDLPGHIRPDVTVAVGYPVADGAPGVRGRFDPIVHLNGFGTEAPVRES
ncbi:MAG TPA: nitroreductase family protein [Streptosporangiaceae bacterium]|jgi:nitroreductase